MFTRPESIIRSTWITADPEKKSRMSVSSRLRKGHSNNALKNLLVGTSLLTTQEGRCSPQGIIMEDFINYSFLHTPAITGTIKSNFFIPFRQLTSFSRENPGVRLKTDRIFSARSRSS